MQLSGTHKQIMNFLGRQIKANPEVCEHWRISYRPKCPLCTCCFLHLLSKAEISPFFQMFPSVPPPRLVSDELETLDSATEGKGAKGSCHCISSPCLCWKTAGRNSLRSVSPPTDNQTREDKNIVMRAVIYSSLNGLPLFSSTSCPWVYSSWPGSLGHSGRQIWPQLDQFLWLVLDKVEILLFIL